MARVDFVGRRLSSDIRSKYPQPIAYRFDSLRNVVESNEPDWFGAVKYIIDLCEIIMQFCSAIAVQSYLRTGDVESGRVSQMIRSLQEKQFSTGHWCELLRETLQCFIGHEDRLFVHELVGFYWQGPKRMTKVARFLNDIPPLRNTVIGHGWKTEDSDKPVVENLPKVGMMLSEMSFLSNYLLFAPISKSGNNYNVLIFEGDGRPDRQTIESQTQLELKDAYLITEEDFDEHDFGRILCLSPLVVYEKCSKCPRKENQIFLFQSYEEDKANQPMTYMAPSCGHRLGIDTYVERLKQLLGVMVEAIVAAPVKTATWNELVETGYEVTRKSIAEVAKKYDPNMYTHRTVETHFHDFMKSEKTAFALLGEAGTGKTNLMCHLAEECRKDGNVVVYLNCASLNSLNLDQTIGEVFDSRVLFKDIAESMSNTAIQEEKEAVIFLDGVNEFEYGGGPLEFIKNLNVLIKDNSEFRNIKFVFSCRTFTWEDLTASSSLALYETAFFTNDEGELYIELGKYNDAELAAAVDRYLNVKSEDLSAELRTTCSDPLILNLMSKTYASGQVPTEAFSWSVMEAYCDKFVPVKDRSARRFIALLVDEMRSNRANEVNLVKLDNERLLNIIDGEQNHSYKRMLDNGILRSAGYDGEKICFTYDRVFEYFLGVTLLRENNGKIPEEVLIDSISKSLHFPTLWGALKIACIKEWDSHELAFADVCGFDDQRVTEFAVDLLTTIGCEDRKRIGEFLKDRLMKSRSDHAKRVAIYTAYNLKDAEVLKAGLLDKSELVRTIATQHAYYFWQHNRDEGLRMYADICSSASIANPTAIGAGISLGFFTYSDNWRDPEFVSEIKPICKDNVERLLGVRESDSGIIRHLKSGVRKTALPIMLSFVARAVKNITDYNNINIPEMNQFFKQPESERKKLHEVAKYGTLERTDIESATAELLEVAMQKNAFSSMVVALIPPAQSVNKMLGAKKVIQEAFDYHDLYAIEVVGNVPAYRILLYSETVDESLLDIYGEGVKRIIRDFGGRYDSKIRTYWTLTASEYAASYTRLHKGSNIPVIEELMDFAKERSQDDSGELLAYMIESVGYFLGAYFGYHDAALRMLEPLAMEFLQDDAWEESIRNRAINAIVKGLVGMRIHHPDDVYRFLRRTEAPSSFAEQVKRAPTKETFGDLVTIKNDAYFARIVIYSPSFRNLLFGTLAAAADCKNTAGWMKYAAREVVRVMCGEDHLK